MSRLEDIIEYYPDVDFLSADGFEDCILGVSYDMINGVYRLVYSRSECISVLIGDGMEYDEANEYFDFNTSGAYVGEKTPIWVDDNMFNEI